MGQRTTRLTRARLALASLVAVGAIASPAVTGHDGFPISTQPMYASTRSDTAVFVTAVGVDSAGAVRRLPTPIIAATDDPLVAVQRSTAASADAARFCTDVARRIAESGRTDIVEIHIVEETWTLSARPTEPSLRLVEHTCLV